MASSPPGEHDSIRSCPIPSKSESDAEVMDVLIEDDMPIDLGVESSESGGMDLYDSASESEGRGITARTQKQSKQSHRQTYVLGRNLHTVIARGRGCEISRINRQARAIIANVAEQLSQVAPYCRGSKRQKVRSKLDLSSVPTRHLYEEIKRRLPQSEFPEAGRSVAVQLAAVLMRLPCNTVKHVWHDVSANGLGIDSEGEDGGAVAEAQDSSPMCMVEQHQGMSYVVRQILVNAICGRPASHIRVDFLCQLLAGSRVPNKYVSRWVVPAVEHIGAMSACGILGQCLTILVHS